MLCVVSHDAGGAELLASYVARDAICCEFVLGGAALGIFQRRLGFVSPITLEHALAQCDEFLTGTSWKSNLEWQAIAAARQLDKQTTSFLDHWGNYRERFVRNGVECLPDTLWVGDEIAEKLATDTFPETPVKLVANPYFKDIYEALSKVKVATEQRSSKGLKVLFVCEPISEHCLRQYGDERYWGYTEFDALRYFFANQAALGEPLASLMIRPHPAEATDKYDQIAAELGEIVSVGGKKTLFQEIVESDVIVGCETMAMVIGLIAGRRVISSIPFGGRPCALPQFEIESLQDLEKTSPRNISFCTANRLL